MRKILLFFALLAASFAMAQGAEELPEIDARWIKTNYVKAEYMIPMRDGVKLYTAVYVPKKKAKAKK